MAILISTLTIFFEFFLFSFIVLKHQLTDFEHGGNSLTTTAAPAVSASSSACTPTTGVDQVQESSRNLNATLNGTLNGTVNATLGNNNLNATHLANSSIAIHDSVDSPGAGAASTNATAIVCTSTKISETFALFIQ